MNEDGKCEEDMIHFFTHKPAICHCKADRNRPSFYNQHISEPKKHICRSWPAARTTASGGHVLHSCLHFTKGQHA